MFPANGMTLQVTKRVLGQDGGAQGSPWAGEAPGLGALINLLSALLTPRNQHCLYESSVSPSLSPPPSARAGKLSIEGMDFISVAKLELESSPRPYVDSAHRLYRWTPD